MHNAAKWNGKTLTEEEKSDIKRILDNVSSTFKTSTSPQSKLYFWHMFTKQNLKKTIIILFNWVTTCFGAYTLMLNIVDLSGDLFLNYILMALVGDIPGVLMLMVTMKYFGRRINFFFVQGLLGICCLILAFIPKTVSEFRNILSLI